MRHAWIRLVLGTLLLVTALFSPGAAAQPPLTAPDPAASDETASPTPAPPTKDPFFGIVQSIHDPEHAMAAGAAWERLVFWWSSYQPSGPDEWIADASWSREELLGERARGIEPVGVVLHTPPWAAREGGDPAVSPPHNLELPYDDPSNYWGRFMARLAAEYAGVIDTWIIWNEPEFCWTGTVEEYAQLQRVAYLAVKAANPNATVILTGTTYWQDHEKGRPLFLARLLDELAKDPPAGAGEPSAPPADAPEATATPDWAPYPAPDDLAPTLTPTPTIAERHSYYFDAVAVHQYGSSLNSYTVPMLYRRILESHGLNKPLWFPESNVVPHDDPLKTLMRGGLRATMDEQASYVIQSVALARAAGIARYSIYKMRDEEPENDQYYGLVRNDGSPRPAYTAYQVAVRELSHTEDASYFWSGSATPPTVDEITALLASTANRAQFVWPGALNGVRLRRGADRVTVLWNATAAPLEIGVPSSAPAATLVTKFGEASPLVRAEDGAFRLTLAPATNNTDARDPSLVLVGGDPVILVEPGAALAPDPYPRPIDACWGVPGALVPAALAPEEETVDPLTRLMPDPAATVTPNEDAVTPTPAEAATATPEPPPIVPVRPIIGAAPTVTNAEPSEDTSTTISPTAEASPVTPVDWSLEEAWVAPTGYVVSGPWLEFMEASGGVDILGFPRSPVVADPLDGTVCVQYFQRAVLEWRPDQSAAPDETSAPEAPPTFRVQRRLLGALLGPAAPAAPPTRADGPDDRYFAVGDQGLGHAVTNIAPDGTRVGFKEYFDHIGGESIVGYPMEPPTLRVDADGVSRWMQRFQAAMFAYHPEFDIDGVKPGTSAPWRTWRVQLVLLGDEYLRDQGLPYVWGDASKHVLHPPRPTP